MQAMRKVISYLKHRFAATSVYGAHSPFLYELFNEVFDKPFSEQDRLAWEEHLSLLLSDRHPIRFEEHGAGNNQNRTMTIAEIAKSSSISSKEARLLINLTKHIHPATILELGTSTGVSANAFRIAAPEAKITTIEGCRELAEYIGTLRKDEQTQIIATTFDDFFASPSVVDQKWDLVYIDGNHAFDATLRYYEIIKEKHSHKGTCLIFDDIYWSAGMTNAWKKIITDPSNTLTLDLFCMGIVFFDPKLSKQHFCINF